MPSHARLGLFCLLAICLGSTAVTTVINETAEAQVYEAVELHEVEKQLGAEGLESLLHWAIEHSEPGALHDMAEASLEASEGDRREKIRQLVKHVNEQPTEVQLMEEALDVLANSSNVDEHIDALDALTVLMEPIDNANDLMTLGGVDQMVSLLSSDHPAVQSGAAAVLGVAAANNAQFVTKLLDQHPDAVDMLLQLTKSTNAPVVNKSLYALGKLLRSSSEARQQLYNGAGVGNLLLLLKNEDSRVRSKATTLVGDLPNLDPDLKDTQAAGTVAQALVDRLSPNMDVDLIEKVLTALAEWAGAGSSRHGVDDGKLVGACDWLKQQALEDVGDEYMEGISQLCVRTHGMVADGPVKDEL